MNDREIVSLEELNRLCDNGNIPLVFVDLATVPFRMRMDYATRNANLSEGKPFCTRCNGTGNEHYFTYRKCQNCNGEGVQVEPERT